MRSRLAVCVLGVWTLLASATAQAQPPGTIAPPRIYAPAPYDASNSWPAFGVPAYDNYPNAQVPRDGQYGVGPDGLITEQISGDRGFDYEDSPVDRFLTAAAKSTWIRLEYLPWRFDGPGDSLLGSPVAGETDPSEPFQATIAGQPATVQIPTTRGLLFPNVQGIRGTVGLPTSAGTLEANFFAFSRTSSGQFLAVAPPSPTAPELQIQFATSTRLNGQISNNLFLYDSSFELFQSTRLFGTEANWVANSPYENGFVVRPLAGFRYIDFQERLFQRGTFDQQGLLPTPLLSDIDSNATNRIYAPQIGMRFEWVDQWFTVGIEPKVAFGINQFDANVRTVRLRSPGDPAVSTTADGSHFAPIGDFSVYGKLHLRDNFSLFVSYQLMVAGGISRPADNIFYNDNGSAQPAGVVVSPSFQSMVWQGLTIGGEVRFR
ncbi:MAG: BBP7 family outer membrane beta-barrel protein [Planctomycetaceae bacterium]